MHSHVATVLPESTVLAKSLSSRGEITFLVKQIVKVCFIALRDLLNPKD